MIRRANGHIRRKGGGHGKCCEAIRLEVPSRAYPQGEGRRLRPFSPLTGLLCPLFLPDTPTVVNRVMCYSVRSIATPNAYRSRDLKRRKKGKSVLSTASHSSLWHVNWSGSRLVEGSCPVFRIVLPRRHLGIAGMKIEFAWSLQFQA